MYEKYEKTNNIVTISFANLLDFDNEDIAMSYVSSTNNKISKITNEVRRIYNDSMNDIFVTATLGCATFPNDGQTFEEVFNKAEEMLYQTISKVT